MVLSHRQWQESCSAPHLPTPEATPAVRTGTRRVSARASAEEEQGLWCPILAARELARLDAIGLWAGRELDEEETARREISDEDHYDGGPWVSKGNPAGFLDSEDEEIVDQMGHNWRLRRMSRMTGDEWEEVARFLLTYTVNIVNSELVETDGDMKILDLILRILGEDGSVDGEGRKRISDAYLKLARDRDESYQQQDDVEDKLEARDGMIVGLREQLAELTTRKDSSELEKRLADQTRSVAMLAENGVWMKEMLQVAERRAEKAEEKAEEKWKA